MVDLEALPQVAAADVRLLWVNDFYDLPLEAVVEHGGVRCLLILHDKNALADREATYRWLLYRLTPEWEAEEEKWHALFVHHVGDHWCFHEGTPHAPETGDRDPATFYAAVKSRQPFDLSAEKPLGWLDEMPSK